MAATLAAPPPNDPLRGLQYVAGQNNQCSAVAALAVLSDIGAFHLETRRQWYPFARSPVAIAARIRCLVT